MSRGVISSYIQKITKSKFWTPDSVKNLSDEWKQLISNNCICHNYQERTINIMEGLVKNPELNTFITSNLFPYLCLSNFRQNGPQWSGGTWMSRSEFISRGLDSYQETWTNKIAIWTTKIMKVINLHRSLDLWPQVHCIINCSNKSSSPKVH